MKWSRPRLQASLPGRLLYKAGLYSRAIDWLSVAVVYPNMLAKSNNSYMQMISKAYSDERIFARHMNEIDGLVEAAESVGSRPVFVLWPNLVDPLGTRWMVAKVKAHLQNQGIPAVDLSEYLLSFDLDKRTVNPLDAHPSEELNFSLGLSLARCLPLLSSDVSSYSLQNCIEANV